VHASLWADPGKRGVAVGECDLIIGATPIGRNYTVATRNERSFSKIPGLSVQLL
jgi:predicted nucleic acid-binding protein